MRYESRIVTPRQGIGVGPEIFRTESWRDLGIQLSGTFTATFNLMGRAFANGPWAQVIADITAPGWYVIPVVLFEVRLDTEAWTSQTDLAAALVGLNHRGE
jgi:hypothetical protein